MQVHSQKLSVVKPRPSASVSVRQRAFERLERLEGKLSRAVLRGREASNGLLLPDPIAT